VEDSTLIGVPTALLALADNPKKGALSLDGMRLMRTEEGQSIYLAGYRPWKEPILGRWKVLQSVNWSTKDEK
jgi:hypothetical protein